jgi:hypothetical protein
MVKESSTEIESCFLLTQALRASYELQHNLQRRHPHPKDKPP